MWRLVWIAAASAAVAAVVPGTAEAVVPSKTIRSADGKLQVFIPRGALTRNVRITIRAVAKTTFPASVRRRIAAGTKVYALKPDGLRLRKPARFTWRVTRPGGFEPSEVPVLVIGRRDSRGKFHFLSNQAETLAAGALVIRGTTRRFSSFSALDTGTGAFLSPKSVVKRVGETWEASAGVRTTGIALKVDWLFSRWFADDDVVKLLSTAVSSPHAFFKCNKVGDGYFGAAMDVIEEDDVTDNPRKWFGRLFTGVLHLDLYVQGKAKCTAETAAGCAAGPAVAPNTSGEVQLTGQCAGLLPAGLHSARLDAPAGHLIFGFSAHSTTCGPGPPSLHIECTVKPDGRICLRVLFDTPVPPGTTVRVRLFRGDGSVLTDQMLTVGSTAEAPCATGS